MEEGIKRRLLSVSYVATIFFAIHYFALHFILATYLNQYFSKEALSIIFAVGALLSIVGSDIFGKVLKRYSNKQSLTFVVLIQIFVTLLMGFSNFLNVYFIGLLFIIQSALFTVIWTSANVFIEEFSDHDSIGAIRGTVLTIYNFGAIASPFISAQIYNLFGFSGLFMISTLALVPLLILINRFFSHVKEPKYNHVSLRESFSIVKKDKNIRGVIASSFVLNSFYAVINVYLVLYLTSTLGIPLLIYLELLVPITLIPFVLIPYQLGKYSDEIFGEKKAMILGIFIMSLILILIYGLHINTTNIFIWVVLIFIARLGATITETENYAYFYKKVDGRSAGLIALFQNMINISFIFVTLLGGILIDLFNIELPIMFLIVGIIGFLSIFVITKIRDTEIKRRNLEAEKLRIKLAAEEKLAKEEEIKEAIAQNEWDIGN